MAHLCAFIVTKQAAWIEADNSHNVRTLFSLARTPHSGVRGPFPSNIFFFFFQTLPGNPAPQEVQWSALPTPPVNVASDYDPSITSAASPLIDHVIGITDNVLSAFFGINDVQHYQLAPTP